MVGELFFNFEVFIKSTLKKISKLKMFKKDLYANKIEIIIIFESFFKIKKRLTTTTIH